MQLIEKHHARGDELNGKDIKDRLKLFTSDFDKKLGEISDYVFNVVGREVDKNIAQAADAITKVQSESITLRRFKDDPRVIAQQLRQDGVKYREKIKRKMYDEVQVRQLERTGQAKLKKTSPKTKEKVKKRIVHFNQIQDMMQ